MAIADTITSMQTHTSNAYTMIGYGTDLTGINKNLENLSTSIFNAFLESLRNPDTLFTNLPKITGSGSNITLNDTANAPMRITLGSRALEQETTTGKNKMGLVDGTYTSGTNTMTVENGIIKFNGSTTASRDFYIPLVANTVLDNGTTNTFSAKVLKGTVPANTIAIRLLTTNSATTANSFAQSYRAIQNGSSAYISYTQTEQQTFTYAYVYVGANANLNFEMGYQLETGSSMTSYEKFTYGASPNPSYPQDIHTISESNTLKVEGKNLFNKNAVTNGKYVNSTTGELSTGTTNYNATDFIQVYTGDYIWGTTSGTGYHLAVYDKNKTFIRAVGRTDTQPIKITIASNEKYVRYTVLTADLDTQQFERNSTATPYTPYTLETKDIDLKSKNLFNNYISTSVGFARCTASYDNGVIVLNTTGADAYFGNVVNSGSSWDSTKGQLIEVEPSTKYTLSISNSLFRKNFVTSYDENKVSLGTTQLFSSISTITTPATAKYVSLRIGYNDSVANGTYRMNIQFEKGETATKYEPYYDYGQCGSIGNYENIPIRTSGKNIIGTLQQGGLNNGAETGSTNRVRTDFIPVLSGENYTISNKDTIVNQLGLSFYDENKTFISAYSGGGWLNFPQTITMLSNAKYVRVIFRNSSNADITPDLNYMIMINKGSTALPYEPYGNGTWYSKQEIGKIDSYNGETITTTYISTTGGLDTGATIYYGITPTYTPITGTLAEQLENVYKNMLSQAGQTNISQVNDDLSFNLSVQAIEEL